MSIDPLQTSSKPLLNPQTVEFLAARKLTLLLSFIAFGMIGYAASFAMKATFTGRLSFISPQPQQSSAVAALASLSALSSLGAGSAGLKSPADQYITLMQSITVSDRLIDRFKLMDEYDVEYRVDARKELMKNVRFAAGKKDNLITVEVDDHDKVRAADMANAYLDELRGLASKLALTEAQQRRVFFERQLEQTRARLSQAQLALQRSGFSASALKAEPKATAEAYAQTKAKIAMIEVRLQSMRKTLTDQSAEVQEQTAALGELRAQLAQLEKPLSATSDQDYLSAYREYKYEEAVMEIYARQFELAKLDESREGAPFQVIDQAMPAEKKSKPIRSLVAAFAAVVGLALTALALVYRQRSRAGGAAP
jgi:uncharacterized protein involved in exopolysaccharide biosynthesis